jgi:hypothetical protein
MSTDTTSRSYEMARARWRGEWLPWSAVAVLAISLLTIPYGAPMPPWYQWMEVGAGVLFGIALLADPRRRWRDLTYWPLVVILAAWGLSIAGCAFPKETADRSIGMAGYSVLFIAVQVAMRRSATLHALRWIVSGVLLLIALDVAWQRWDGYSLIREVRAGELHRQFTGFTAFGGSQGNRNDLAVVGVLLPLAIPPLRLWPSMVFAGVVAAATASTWLISESRQTMMAWGVSLAGLLGLRASWRTRFAVVGTLLAVCIVAIYVVPGLRARFMGIMENPLGDRGMPTLYSIKLFLDAPLFGVGPSLFGHYWVLGVRDGWQWEGRPLPAVGMPWVHCVPLEVLCELGITGLAAYSAAISGGVAQLRRCLRGRSRVRDLAAATLVAVSSAALVSLLDITFIKNWVRIVFWLLLGLSYGITLALRDDPQDVSRRTGTTKSTPDARHT